MPKWSCNFSEFAIHTFVQLPLIIMPFNGALRKLVLIVYILYIDYVEQLKLNS